MGAILVGALQCLPYYTKGEPFTNLKLLKGPPSSLNNEKFSDAVEFNSNYLGYAQYIKTE